MPFYNVKVSKCNVKVFRMESVNISFLLHFQEGYWSVINERLVNVLSTLKSPPHLHMCREFNFNLSHSMIAEQQVSHVIAMCHAIWQHASIGQLTTLPRYGHLKLISNTLLLCYINYSCVVKF